MQEQDESRVNFIDESFLNLPVEYSILDEVNLPIKKHKMDNIMNEEHPSLSGLDMSDIFPDHAPVLEDSSFQALDVDTNDEQLDQIVLNEHGFSRSTVATVSLLRKGFTEDRKPRNFTDLLGNVNEVLIVGKQNHCS